MSMQPWEGARYERVFPVPLLGAGYDTALSTTVLFPSVEDGRTLRLRVTTVDGQELLYVCLVENVFKHIPSEGEGFTALEPPVEDRRTISDGGGASASARSSLVERRWDPWGRDSLTWLEFINRYSGLYPAQDLERCWSSLRVDTPNVDLCRWPLAAHIRQHLDARPLGDRPQSCAIVSLVYGTGIDTMMQAMALGNSLRRHDIHPRILLHTRDMPSGFRSVLGTDWILRAVDDIIGEETLTQGKPQFERVFTKLHIFNPDVFLPSEYDRVLFLDADTLVNDSLEDLLTAPWAYAAVPCPSAYSGDVKLLRRELEPGTVLTGHDTFNGGVLYVTPDRVLFRALISDCIEASEWHVPTSHPESHFLKWAMLGHWRALDAGFNLCTTLTKGQANFCSWHHLTAQSVRIFHFMNAAKPYRWIDRGTIAAMRSADEVDGLYEHNIDTINRRAHDAFRLWLHHFGSSVVMWVSRFRGLRGGVALRPTMAIAALIVVTVKARCEPGAKHWLHQVRAQGWLRRVISEGGMSPRSGFCRGNL